jgi:hypothetical protein
MTGSKMDLTQYLESQRREIEKHKWIESEKAGRDLGMDAAIDWIMKYADAFSDQFVREHCSRLPQTGSNSAS